MSTFRFQLAALLTMSTWLVSAAFRQGRHGIGLLLLGAMVACLSGEATTPDAAPAALDSADPTAADSNDAPAAQGTITFSIDGQPEPGVSCVLTDRGAEKGFLLSFSSEQLWEVGIVQTDKSPLIVGKVAILDGNSSPAYAAATLPSRFNKEAPEGHRDYISFVGLTESGADYLNVYDWGAGIRRLTDREVGQVVFTRIGNGTADDRCEIFV